MPSFIIELPDDDNNHSDQLMAMFNAAFHIRARCEGGWGEKFVESTVNHIKACCGDEEDKKKDEEGRKKEGLE